MTNGGDDTAFQFSETRVVAERDRSRKQIGLAYLSIGFGITLVSLVYCGILEWQRYAGALDRTAAIAIEAFPPDFTRWRSWILPLLETLAMSIASTVIGGITALVLAIFATRRNFGGAVLIGVLLRGTFNLLRSLPELVLGIILVVAVGFGSLAGMIALALHSVGMLGKFFAELVEHADAGPIEALQAQGASRGQIFYYGILPQVLPRVMDLALYRWEHNLRASTVMGLVGAGGIGFELIAALRLFEYREALALLILTLLLVSAIDFVGGSLRARLVED